jgi:iron complex transport system ATP-binding protein
MSDPISLAGVTVRRGGTTILGPLDWRVREGERWVVLGPNGAGKTTLLQILSMYLWPTTGTVEILGARFGKVDAREHRRRIGYAGSGVEAAMNLDLSPVDVVMSARHAALEPWWHVFTDDDRARARGLVERLGAGRVADHPLRSLSTGERRRVSIARALMADPELLLLDEPGSSLDLGARETLVRDLTTLTSDARLRSIVLVSHHIEEIPPGFGHAILLSEARVVAAGAIGTVLRPDALSTAYGMPIAVEQRDGRFWARMAG